MVRVIPVHVIETMNKTAVVVIGHMSTTFCMFLSLPNLIFVSKTDS